MQENVNSSDTNTDTDVDATGGSDTDVDAGGGGDTDVDAGDGGDTETDTGWDTTPLPGVNLMPNEEGFMKTGENELGIQGAWYTFGCEGATVNPAEGSQFDNPGRMCFSGTAPAVTDENGDGEPDWDTIWGAGMGFDTCAESDEEATSETGPAKYPLSACPYNADLATELIGVSVRFSGAVNANELRIQFNEGEKVANSYYQVDPADVAASTVIDVEFEDPAVRTHYDPGAKPGDTNANNILAIQFQVPTNSDGPVDWDFCVDAISAITAP